MCYKTKIPFLRQGKGKYSHEKQKCLYWKLRFLFFLFVTFLEFINTTRCVYQYILTGKEGVRHVRNFQFNERVFITIFPFNCFFCRRSRTAEKTVPVTHIFKNYEPIILGMKPLIHNSLIFKLCTDFAVLAVNRFFLLVLSAKPQN